MWCGNCRRVSLGFCLVGGVVVYCWLVVVFCILSVVSVALSLRFCVGWWVDDFWCFTYCFGLAGFGVVLGLNCRVW